MMQTMQSDQFQFPELIIKGGDPQCAVAIGLMIPRKSGRSWKR